MCVPKNSKYHQVHLTFPSCSGTKLPLTVIVCYVIIEEVRGRIMLRLSQQTEISVVIAGFDFSLKKRHRGNLPWLKNKHLQ